MKQNPNVLPVSTKVLNGMYATYLFMQWVILCNPVSMIFINWIKPEHASALAHNPKLCGEVMLAFYSRLAQRWPFKWAKWWLTPELLANYTPEQQVEYFLKVDDSQEALNNLHEKSTLLLLKQHPEVIQKILKSQHLPNTLFAQILNSMLVEELPQYIRRETLHPEQFALLMDKAAKDSFWAESTPAGLTFLEYVERYGISREQQEMFKKARCGVNLMYSTYRAIHCYEQRITVQRYNKLRTRNAERKWISYLKKEGKLYVIPSLQMSLQQYYVFNQLGLRLKPDAILRFLRQGDHEMCQEIFRLEPNHGIANDEIRQLVESTPELKTLYDQAV